jgi:hypothetical protein
MSHRQIRTHKIHHGPDLGEATTFPLVVYYVPLHEGHIQMAFCPGIPKWESRNSQTWVPTTLGPITFSANLQLIWGLKQSYSPSRELSNSMWHATFTQGNRVDSWLLVVRSQIVNLTLGLSFDHNLYFRCPNGSCEPISDIYVPRAFRSYKECLNPMSFDPCNCSLKIWESSRTPTPKMGVPLGVWGFIPSKFFAHSGAWNVTPKIPSWPTILQALALVASPRLGLRHHVHVSSRYHC